VKRGIDTLKELENFNKDLNTGSVFVMINNTVTEKYIEDI
tara:strand:- start:18 stop:137 length:120 start_codon:yes stop_codon:yes gene_type:complete